MPSPSRSKDSISKLAEDAAPAGFLQLEFLDPKVLGRKHVGLIRLLRAGKVTKMGRTATAIACSMTPWRAAL